MSYLITQQYIQRNRCYVHIDAIGMVLHDTEDPGATADSEFLYFNSDSRGASAHIFIDWQQILQFIPFSEKAWHACEPANSMFIGVEMCVPPIHDEGLFREVWDRAVWVFADTFLNFLKIDTITTDNLMSHAEVSARWHNTTHQDPVSFLAKYGKTVDDFRNAVQQEINKMKGSEGMTIIIPFSPADHGPAETLAANIKGSVLDWGLVTPDDDVKQIGGPADSKPQNPCKSFEVITGPPNTGRLETAKAVIAYAENGCKK